MASQTQLAVLKPTKDFKALTWKFINTSLSFSMTLFENWSSWHPLRVDRPSALLSGLKIISQIEVFTVQMKEVEAAFYPAAFSLALLPVLIEQDMVLGPVHVQR